MSDELKRQFAARSEDLKRVFGARVKQARLQAGFTSQEELAGAIAVSRQTMSSIEGGKSIPGADTLFFIAEATKRPLDFFFPHVEVMAPSSERLEDKLDQVLEILRPANVIPFPGARFAPDDFPYAPEPVGEEPDALSAANKTRRPQNPKRDGKKSK